ncbi:MAG: hypothetical protein AMK72_03555 [Planctomycetes bacterium SM23_25]|nr:MAG: hypothetical protein AMS14_04860 [Planctomycetes bacterium DG_20]KPK49841.1 MAG: hypothetical protein AMK72_03555 [Planctomycetes bacterium SM23_25]
MPQPHSLSRGTHTPPRGVRLPLLAACLMTLPFAVAAGPDDAQSPATVPEQVQAHLAAAHAARTELAKEHEAWAMEKERLELLASTVRSEAERFRAAAEEAKSDEAKLRSRTEALQAQTQRLEHLEAMIDTVAERLEKALDALTAKSLPGVVPPDVAAGITEPARRLAAGAGRLDQARLRTQRAGIELVVGTLGERQVTVRLLRAGAVAAWWMTLDGKQTGTAAIDAGKLVLTLSKPPDNETAIRKAFAIAEGHAAPDWVLLPVHQTQGE